MKIQLQPNPERHLARWRELCADREIAKLPYKIETDRFGRILMSPPPSLPHGSYQFRIGQLLAQHLPAVVAAQMTMTTRTGTISSSPAGRGSELSSPTKARWGSTALKIS